ncbi:MAG: hypothetical protein J4N76_03880 [Chloroflexi bacterium]|nr:hypothetical protein [Chloroflexota bacterium]MCI0827101.1 hypothetical protein [Chloroflexota bacterium]MCI0875684.1 hypothetical protein [Chloroflexota bacterium]MCI0891799.1 hypothetical protein [Chloroflexota bacterium]
MSDSRFTQTIIEERIYLVAMVATGLVGLAATIATGLVGLAATIATEFVSLGELIPNLRRSSLKAPTARID